MFAISRASGLGSFAPRFRSWPQNLYHLGGHCVYAVVLAVDVRDAKGGGVQLPIRKLDTALVVEHERFFIFYTELCSIYKGCKDAVCAIRLLYIHSTQCYFVDHIGYGPDDGRSEIVRTVGKDEGNLI